MTKPVRSASAPSRQVRAGSRTKAKTPDCSALCESARNTLRDLLVCIEEGDESREGLLPLAGEKEGRLGAFSKWIICLEKISDIERSMQTHEEDGVLSPGPLTPEDIDILERYLAGRKAEIRSEP